MNTSIFDQLTNQYSLSKTLRFELIPIGKTKEWIEKNKIISKDKQIKEKYEKTKPYFNRLHCEFIQESLNKVELTKLDAYFRTYVQWKNNKEKNKENNDKIKMELTEIQKKLREEIVAAFDKTAQAWAKNLQNHKLKKTNHELLFEAEIFAILKQKYSDEEKTWIIDENNKKISIFDSWEKFTGYFKKFFETRKNFYKADGTETAIATRVIDHNLKIFCDNIINFEKIKNKVDWSKVEEHCNIELESVFKIDRYTEFILQDGINFYNKIIGGEVRENGTKYQGINECINNYRQQTGEKVSYFKKLDKQIASEKETSFFEKNISSDEELYQILHKLITESEKRINAFTQILQLFINNQERFNIENIYLTKESYNTIAYTWINEPNILNQAMQKSYKEKNIKIQTQNDEYIFPDFIPLNILKQALITAEQNAFKWKSKYENLESFPQTNAWNQFLYILYFEWNSILEGQTINPTTKEQTIPGYNTAKQAIRNFLTNVDSQEEKKIKIKQFADSALRAYQQAKWFAVEKNREWITEVELDDFYLDPEYGYKEHVWDNAYEQIVQTYNQIRNYLTKRPENKEKWKLTFENPTLAAGWDKNKEVDNSAVLFIKNNKYYLGIF